MLKAGDTWTNESLFPQGAGEYDYTTYNSVSASVFATQLAANLGGVMFTDYRALMVAAGKSLPDATTLATNFCNSKAFLTAEIAARNAAQASSIWAEVSRYGVGADPALNGAGTAVYGINVGAGAAAGWKVSHINAHSFIGAGVQFAIPATGGWLTQCNLHNNNNTGAGLIPGYNFNANGQSIGTGFLCSSVANMFVDNCTCDGNDSPFLFGFGDRGIVDTVSATGSQLLSAYIVSAFGLTGINLNLVGLCNGPGFPSGSGALLMSATTDAIMQGCTFNSTVLHGADGVGIDLEGTNIAAAIFDCTVNSNAGSAFLNFNTGGSNNGTMVDNCQFTNNGIGFAPNTNVTLMRTGAGGTVDQCIFTRNNIVRPTSPSQPFLFASSHNTGPTNTITTWLPNGVFGADNIVT